MKTEDEGQWVKALRPGTLFGNRFVKAGDIVQLGKNDVFTDTWMEKHEAPPEQQVKEKDVEEEQAEAVRAHEEADRVRRGKFSLPSVPRSEESQRERQEKAEEDLQRRREADAAARENPPANTNGLRPLDRATNPVDRRAAPTANRDVQPTIDRGSASADHPQGIHETSANPSRVDESARRSDKE